MLFIEFTFWGKVYAIIQIINSAEIYHAEPL